MGQGKHISSTDLDVEQDGFRLLFVLLCVLTANLPCLAQIADSWGCASGPIVSARPTKEEMAMLSLTCASLRRLTGDAGPVDRWCRPCTMT